MRRAARARRGAARCGFPIKRMWEGARTRRWRARGTARHVAHGSRVGLERTGYGACVVRARKIWMASTTLLGIEFVR